ncbi:hypothetical protein BCR34DRAFT_34780 [Clohesyomyces aquaticus]|uniref:Secreted protein n=1 Tax=Clohesyomyces aquaticus TaxID=1231657 RepID=A0A1Y1Z803_9PLEO|nr:hypothetical protein BCR34DRAFT_34780 [Clohesyomyces aquaticus]
MIGRMLLLFCLYSSSVPSQTLPPSPNSSGGWQMTAPSPLSHPQSSNLPGLDRLLAVPQTGHPDHRSNTCSSMLRAQGLVQALFETSPSQSQSPRDRLLIFLILPSPSPLEAHLLAPVPRVAVFASISQILFKFYGRKIKKCGSYPKVFDLDADRMRWSYISPLEIAGSAAMHGGCRPSNFRAGGPKKFRSLPISSLPPFVRFHLACMNACGCANAPKRKR